MKNLKNKIIISTLSITLLTGGLVCYANKTVTTQTTPPTVELNTSTKTTQNTTAKSTLPAINTNEYIQVRPLEVVAHPNNYLNKKIKFRAVFDKFSTLGLDYKPAFRDSQNYISFLIKRDDVTDHTIPLSEMKIFIKRSEAEKFIDLDSGDIIEVYGKVFSTALTDAWIETEKLVVIEKKKKDAKKA